MADMEKGENIGAPGDAPRQIGPYRILDVLGEGGMAVVYLAEQSEPVRRRVALKMLKAGMDSKQVVARFESERQALAVLEHPNIAKVFDGGQAESGRPYFVMEHVKGVPITDYCDDQRLNTEQRIRLFIDVCAAVQHAHTKGLIHRDLKPSNILVGVVDGKPQPKIIDFGIAKATTTTLSEATLYTKIGQIIGTPQYMSPEQAGVTGVDIDTRADIYSLGVILYELLVGIVPLELTDVGDQAMRVALREKDPPKPSTRLTQLDDTRDEIAKLRRTDPEGLCRKLKGDLDWVVMKAIEKDRTRRYETVNALAMECSRYLDRQPVLARPPSPGYLLRRFVQRHRLVVAAGTIAILAILGGAGAAVLGYVRASEAERVALREAETAEQVSDFLVNLFEVSDPSEARGNTITAREVLDQGMRSVESDLSAQPEIRATLMLTMGRVYQSLGLYEQARHLKEEAYKLRLRELGEDHPDTLEALDSLTSLALDLGDYRDMETLAEKSLSAHRAKFGDTDARTIGALSDLATARSNLGDIDSAVLYSRRALEAARTSEEIDEESLEVYVRRLAIYLDEAGEAEEAGMLYEESLELCRKLYGEIHLQTAFAIDNLAIHYDVNGQFDKAETLYRQVLPILHEVYGKEHPEIAQSMGTYADFLLAAYSETGHAVEVDLDEAKAFAIDALEMNQKLRPGHPFIGDNKRSLAELAHIEGDYSGAESHYRDAIQTYLASLPPGHAKVITAKHELGLMLLGQNRLEEAEKYLLESEKAIEDLKVRYRAKDEVLSGLIALYERSERDDKVIEYRQKLAQLDLEIGDAAD